MKKRVLIINNKLIETNIEHPDENIRDKMWIAELFIKDLKDSKLIKDKYEKKPIYKIFFNKKEYNFIFDTTDSGGVLNGNRKVAIPFSTKSFKNHIIEEKNIFVINLYRPLDIDKKPIEDIRIWLLIKPSEIYNSKVISNKNWNDSSRWIQTKLIKEAIDSNLIIENESKNIFAAKNELINELFNKVNIQKEYDLMNKIKEEAKIFIKSNKNSEIANIRRIFRLLLIQKEQNHMINSKIFNNGLLVASHIQSVEDIKNDTKITEEEKIKKIGDINNGILIPVGLDKLFDKYYITFDNNWNILISDDVSLEEVKELCGREIEGKWIFGKNEETLHYLKKHREKAFEKRNYPN